MEQENAYVKYISTLISKHLQDELTPIEEKELDQWIATDPKNKILFDQINDPKNIKTSLKEILHYDTEKLLTRLKSRINTNEKSLIRNRKQRTSFTRYFAIAATVLIALSYTAYLYLQNTSVENQELIAYQDIVPGGNKARLTLQDGTIVDLSESQNGVVIGNDNIEYTDGTDLFFIQSDEGSLSTMQASTQTLTLTTPKGGKYQIILPDGTKVWLNSASSLKYPNRFNKEERRVELSGEAYFEVAKMQNNFIVISKDQEVKVLGTHFNINAYEDDNEIKTTLLEGSVSVSTVLSSRRTNDPYKPRNSIILVPGQQSINTGEQLIVKAIDPSLVIAWKKGLFSFKNEDIKSVMSQFERWYNIEVIYEGIIPQTTFSGKIYKSEQIDKVYALLDYYKVDYEVNGRQIKIKGISSDQSKEIK